MAEKLICVAVQVEHEEAEHFVPENEGFIACSNWDVSPSPAARALVHMLTLIEAGTNFKVTVYTETI